MESVEHLQDDVFQKLKNISDEHGLTPSEFLNDLLDEYAENNVINKPITNIEDIRKILQYDQPEGNGLDEIVGLISTPEEKNYVEYEKKYVRG